MLILKNNYIYNRIMVKVGITEVISRHPYFINLYKNFDRSFQIIDFKNLWKFFLNLDKIKIFHLHWPEKRLRGEKKITSILKLILFMIFIKILKTIDCKFILTMHNMRPHIEQSKIIDYLIFNITMQLADKIIVHSEYSKLKLNYYYPEVNINKIAVIKMGSTSSHLNLSYHDRNLARFLRDFKNNKILLLIFGKIEKYKGINNNLELITKLLDATDKFKIAIIGECREDEIKEKIDFIKNKYRNRVHIELNYVDDERMKSYFKYADFGVIPFNEITNSSSVEQYLFHKTPIFAPKFKTINEIFPNYSGWLTKFNLNQWYDLILKFINDKEFYEQIQNETRFYEPYRWSKSSLITSKLYRSVILSD